MNVIPEPGAGCLRLVTVDGVLVKSESLPPKTKGARAPKPSKPSVEEIQLRGGGYNDKKLVATLKAMGDGKLLDILIGLRADVAQFEREVERRRTTTKPAIKPAPKPYDGPRLLVLAEEAAKFEKGKLLVTEEDVLFRFTGYGRAWPGTIKDAEISGRSEMMSKYVCYAYGTVVPPTPTV